MKIFCSGIGGIGLSAYAALRYAQGDEVAGSDRSDSALLDDLRSQGIGIFLNQDGSAVAEDTDLFVYSEAIPEDAPERVRGRELNIRQISYFAALGEYSRDMNVIAVCGTHGKSSTTAMAARMLIALGADPTVVVGTKLKELDGRNWRRGGSNLLVVEACEYRRSFHYLLPNTVLLLNADGDHFDAYSGPEEYREAFADFVNLLPEDGFVITHASDPDCMDVMRQSGRRMIDADDEPMIAMKTPGDHMRQNAQLVLRLAREMGLNHDDAVNALAGFEGTWRRMEIKGTFSDDVLLVDDYGHHPREITATLAALKERYEDRRLICVFQPHTHDRTLKLYHEFCDAFSSADHVLLTDVYEARKDIETMRVNMPTFAEDVAKGSDAQVEYVGDLDSAHNRLLSLVQPHDLAVCMGAGTITNLASRLIKEDA